MKNKIFSALCGIMLVAFATAQVPESLNYQAVVRNVAGLPIANSSVAVRIIIHDGTSSGTTVYSERDTATTNQFGLFSAQIGTGNVISGTFAGINWANGNKFMQVELDPTGGSSYTDMGTTQLLSVPYALHARTAHLADSATNVPSVWTTSGNDIYNANSGNVGIGTSTPTYGLEIANGGNSLKLTSPFCCTQITMDDQAATDVYLSSSLGQFDIWTGGNNRRITVLPNGNVGIGNTAPTAKLHVNVDGTDGYAGLGITSTLTGGKTLTINQGTPGTLRFTEPNVTDLVTMDFNTNRVGVGITNPAATLDVAGNVKITDGSEGAGKLLVSDANGLASWQTVAVGTSSYTGLSHQRSYISTSTLSPYVNISTTASVLIIPAAGPSNGLIHGFQHNGADEIVIYNNNATNWTIVPGQSVPSVPFYTGPGATNYVIGPGKSVRIFYEPTTAKWWVLDGR